MRHDAAKGAKPRGPESTTAAGAACRIELLGWLRVRQAERLIPRFRTRQTGALLAYLAYFRQRSHPRDVLIELLWPEADGDPRHQLRNALSALRRQLEPPGTPAEAVLVTDRATVRLNPDAVTTDVGDFEAALEAAKQARSAVEQRRRLSEAVALYRGELLPGYFESWIEPERRRLEETFLEALAQLAHQAETAGALAQAVEWARRAVATDPLREEAQHALIRLLVLAGERDAAQRQHDEFEQQLREQLGVAPDPETGALLRESVVPKRRPLMAAQPRSDREASASAPPAAPSRPSGTVTFLLIEAVAPQPRAENARAAAAPVCEWPVRVMERHGGQALRFGSDSLLAVFARASDAAAAAVASMEGAGRMGSSVSGEVPETEDPIRPRPRMALHTGELERDVEEYRGPAMEHAVRLLLAAHPGQLLCSDATAALLRAEEEPGKPGYPLADLGVYRLRDVTGVAVRERLFHIRYAGMQFQRFPPPQGALPLAGDLPLRLTRFVGRDAEIASLCTLLGFRHRETEDAEDEEEMGNGAPLGLCGGGSPSLAGGTRLVMLTGPGGSGKTRLALEVAERLVEVFGGAVWFVPLADLIEAGRIPDAARSAMRLPPTPHLEPLDQVVKALAQGAPGRPSLLVLDNFEHLVEGGAAVVRTLLERVPALTLLITSRQSLGLEGEQEFPVGPLPIPVDGSGLMADGPAKVRRPDPSTIHHHLSALLQCTSVRLFVDRAQAAQPDFQLTAANAAAVAALCAKLEGLPLAIELAAARAGMLTPRQMLAHLEHRFEFLVSRKRNAVPRHESLRAALDWSYTLLSPELQRFFARLSVFRGSFSLEAISGNFGFWTLDFGLPARLNTDGDEPVRATPDPRSPIQNPLDALEQLLRCSLVRMEETSGGLSPLRCRQPAQVSPPWPTAGARQPEAQTRYRLLETLREYGWERLTAQGGADAARRAHFEYFRSLAEAAEPELRGPEQALWLARLEVEHDNCRAALDWAVERDPEAGLRLAQALVPFWETRGYWKEGSERLQALLARSSAAAAGWRAGAMTAAGVLVTCLGEYQRAEALFQESLALSRQAGDAAGAAAALHHLGGISAAQGELSAAQRRYEESLGLYREQGDQHGIAAVLRRMGLPALHQGELNRARTLYEASLAIYRTLGDQRGIAASLAALGTTALSQERYEEARSFFEQSLALAWELDDLLGIAIMYHGLGRIAHREGDTARARADYEQSLAIRRELGDQRGVASVLTSRAHVEQDEGALARAAACYEESLAIRRQLGEKREISLSLRDMGDLARWQGEYSRAYLHYQEGLEIAAELGIRLNIAGCLEDLGKLALAREQNPSGARRATRLFGAAAALLDAAGHPSPTDHLAEYKRHLAAARAHLGDDTFVATWEAGRALTLEQAVAEALDEGAPAGSEPPAVE